MSIFTKEEETIIDHVIERVRNEKLRYYLREIKKKNINNPFENDELLCNVIINLDYYDESKLSTLGPSVRKIIESFAEFYYALAPLGTATNDYEKINAFFLNVIKPNNVEHYRKFSRKLFNLFVNKEEYINVMNAIFSNEIDIQEYYPMILHYAISSREYFADEHTFSVNVQRVINSVGKTGDLTEEKVQKLTDDNRRRAGIYDIDRTTLERVDASVNGARSVVGVLTARIEEANKLLTTIDLKTKEFETFIRSLINDATTEISTKARNAITDFSTEYSKYLLSEKNSLTNEKDKIIRELMAAFERKMGELDGISKTITANTALEIRRVHDEGTDILSRIESMVKDSPELQKTLEGYKSNADIIGLISRLEGSMKSISVENPSGFASNSSSSSKFVVTTPSYYFDESIRYKERYSRLMDKKKRQEDNGVLFHKMFDDVLTLIIEDFNPYLWGPSGCGKTFMLKQIAAFLEIPLLDIGKINESYDILGTANIKGEYNYPLFFQGYAGGAIVLADELDASIPNAVITLNNFASGNAEYNFSYYGQVKRHPNFRLVTAGNTKGNGGSEATFGERLKLEESIQQRLTIVEVDYDSQVDERIFTDKYKEWYLFSELFRAATTDYSRTALDGEIAPGIFTTRDVAKVKKALDDESLTLDKIVLYEFIQNKSPEYLQKLAQFVESNSSEYECHSSKVKKLTESFLRQAKPRIDGYNNE